MSRIAKKVAVHYMTEGATHKKMTHPLTKLTEQVRY